MEVISKKKWLEILDIINEYTQSDNLVINTKTDVLSDAIGEVLPKTGLGEGGHGSNGIRLSDI